MKLEENRLTVPIFCSLRKYGPFVEYKEEDVAEALEHTLYSIVIKSNDEAIAMGRVVGDGRIAFFIKDVVVHPNYRDQNLGYRVVESLLTYIKEKGASKAYVGLMASLGTEGFYEKFGFIKRPNENYGAGMILFLEEKHHG